MTKCTCKTRGGFVQVFNVSLKRITEAVERVDPWHVAWSSAHISRDRRSTAQCDEGPVKPVARECAPAVGPTDGGQRTDTHMTQQT